MDNTTVLMTAAGTSFALAVTEGQLRVLHWGVAVTEGDIDALTATSTPGQMFSSTDTPRTLSMLPMRHEGWSGTPALQWHRAGLDAEVRLTLESLTHSAPKPHPAQSEAGDTPAEASAPQLVTATWRDSRAHVTVAATWTLSAQGVLSSTVTVTSTGGEAPLDLSACLMSLPLPVTATHITDFTGRWTAERRPQTIPVSDGAHVRTSRRGRPGHDAAYLTMVGPEQLTFDQGAVWAAHVAYSGDQEVRVERLPEGAGVHAAVMMAGELLEPGAVRLETGQSYQSPAVVWAHSTGGIDGLSAALHQYIRAMPWYPRSPRPLTLNTWEAVYFDHNPQAMTELLDVAHQIGVERFVVDDGWFMGRRSDKAGLGDWDVDPAVWPDGLETLARDVHSRGMQFGLWVEPEMVNRDSELARRHPEWVLGEPSDIECRNQAVLDVSLAPVREYLLAKIDALVTNLQIDYLKWDHNRDVHITRSHVTGRSVMRAHVAGTYALLAELGRRHPHLEIESCASGGARMDLGIAPYVDRFWASDSNDPLERQAIQRWSTVLFPHELLGSHVGPERAHTTHRSADLSMRLTTALFGHAGIEWDVRTCTQAEREALTRWAALYKSWRPLLHSGRTVRCSHPDPGLVIHGVVAADASAALFSVARLALAGPPPTARVTLPGLDPAAQYVLTLREDLGVASRHAVSDPAWVAGGLRASGDFLAQVGVPMPHLNPGQALLWELKKK